MANSVRKICTKIGNGPHQLHLLGTAKPSSTAYPVPDTVQQRRQREAQFQAQEKRDPCRAFRQPRPAAHFACPPVADGRRSVAAAVQWLDTLGGRENVVSPILNTAVAEPDDSVKHRSGPNNDGASDPDGLPSAQQLDNIYNKLGEDLPTMFKQNLDYSLYHPKLVFENNIRGTKTVGLEYFMSTISILRLIGHLKYAFVKFDILKITKHPEDGTVKIRWRIKGISGMKVFLKFWKFSLFDLEKVIKENVESWHDGFSVFSVGSDGLVHKLTADKMQPDNDPVIEDKSPLATKLALFLGLSPQLNNLGCFITCDSEQTNELLKMVMISLEDVI